jgi:Raf kinase inhibitor-like YbhB/YbcL family protein
MADRAPLPYDFMPPVASFSVTSDDVTDGAQMKNEGCSDAPTGSGFWHWLLIDVPALVTSLPAGAGAASGPALPQGAFHVRNDYGTRDFGGAAPPQGDAPHRHVFAVHALDVNNLGVDSDVTPAVAGFNLRFHTIGRGLLVPFTGTKRANQPVPGIPTETPRCRGPSRAPQGAWPCSAW